MLRTGLSRDLTNAVLFIQHMATLVCHVACVPLRTDWFFLSLKVDVEHRSPQAHHWPSQTLSGLVAGDSAICGRLAALILRLRPAGLRFEEFRSPVKRGGLGLRFSNRSGLRPAAI